MSDESRFTEETWDSWLEPFQAVRILIDAGLADREQAVNWLKGRLRGAQLKAGGWHLKFSDDSQLKSEAVPGLYRSKTWERVAAIPWKDDFWVSGSYCPDDPLDESYRQELRDEFKHYLNHVRFDPQPINDFAERCQAATVKITTPSRKSSAGGRPPKPFWDNLWASVAAQLYNGDLKPERQVDIESAMHVWLDDNGENAGETAIRAKARLLWLAIGKEVEN